MVRLLFDIQYEYMKEPEDRIIMINKEKVVKRYTSTTILTTKILNFTQLVH